MNSRKAFYLGVSKEEVHEYKQALRYYKKALTKAQTNGSKREKASILLKIADLYRESIKNYPQAVDYYTKGLGIVQVETIDEWIEGQMCTGIADAYRHLGQQDKATKYAKEGLKIALRLDDLEMTADSYQCLGGIFGSQYNFDNSIKCFKKSIDMYGKMNNKVGLITCIQNLSSLYLQQGKYHDSIHHLENALTKSREIGKRKMEAHCLFNMGNIYYKLKDTQQVLDFYQKSLTIAIEINDKSLQAQCYINIGNYWSTINNPQNGISMYKKALESAHDIDQRMCTTLYLSIGTCMSDLGHYQDAVACFNKSMNIAKEMSEKDVEAAIYHNIAEICVKQKDFSIAIEQYKISLKIASSIQNKELESVTCYKLGRLYHTLFKEDHDQQNLTSSEEFLNKALDCYDFLFKNLHHRDQFKISCLETFLKTYKLLTTVLIEKDQIQDALLVADRERARALGDRLTFKYGIARGEISLSHILTYADCQEMVSNGIFSVLHYSLLEESLAVWVLTKGSMKFKEAEKEDYVSLIKTGGEDDGLTRFFAATVRMAYNKMGIKASRTCENRSLDNCLVFSSEQTRNDGSESLTRDDTIEENLGGDFDPFEVLYNCLLSPVIEHVQHDEIVIIPDREMYTVPFAALRDPETGLYLSDTKRIRLAPSMAILKVLQECPVNHHSGKGSLIVGDPSVGEVILRGKKTTLERLPCAGIEVSVLASKLGTIALEGEKANKAAVLAKLREGAALIHIAAHGSSDNGEIALAPNPSPDRQGIPEEEDYLLTIKEVEQIGIKAQLVVLSCCHSGRGDIKAEGIMGLSRAFLVAGARAVVASLWAIDDTVTLRFMVSFYDNLCEGKTASVSLNKAMKEIRKGYTDQKYWAPFFLIGDDVTLDLRK